MGIAKPDVTAIEIDRRVNAIETERRLDAIESSLVSIEKLIGKISVALRGSEDDTKPGIFSDVRELTKVQSWHTKFWWALASATILGSAVKGLLHFT